MQPIILNAGCGQSGPERLPPMFGSWRHMRVDIDPDQLLALGVTASDISRQLRRIQTEASGGRTDVGTSEQSVRLIATA